MALGLGNRIIKFQVYPVVREETDRRQNKQSDYSILKIFNRITYIVVQVKLSQAMFEVWKDLDTSS